MSTNIDSLEPKAVHELVVCQKSLSLQANDLDEVLLVLLVHLLVYAVLASSLHLHVEARVNALVLGLRLLDLELREGFLAARVTLDIETLLRLRSKAQGVGALDLRSLVQMVLNALLRHGGVENWLVLLGDPVPPGPRQLLDMDVDGVTKVLEQLLEVARHGNGFRCVDEHRVDGRPLGQVLVLRAHLHQPLLYVVALDDVRVVVNPAVSTMKFALRIETFDVRKQRLDVVESCLWLLF